MVRAQQLLAESGIPSFNPNQSYSYNVSTSTPPVQTYSGAMLAGLLTKTGGGTT